MEKYQKVRSNQDKSAGQSIYKSKTDDHKKEVKPNTPSTNGESHDGSHKGKQDHQGTTSTHSKNDIKAKPSGKHDKQWEEELSDEGALKTKKGDSDSKLSIGNSKK